MTIVVITDIVKEMTGKILQEIKQGKPLRQPEEEAFLSLLLTADRLMQGLVATLKPHGLSATQYNVLRILRGSGADGLACGEIAGRMITRDPDITRLLDRLEARGLVARSREKKDRRVIVTRITEDGLKMLKELDAPVKRLHGEQLGHMGEKKLHSLVELLDLARRE